MLISCR